MGSYVRHDMRPRRVHVVMMHMEPARSATAIRALRRVLLVLLFAQFVPLLPFPQRLLVLGGLLARSHLLRARVVGHLQTSQHETVIRECGGLIYLDLRSNQILTRKSKVQRDPRVQSPETSKQSKLAIGSRGVTIASPVCSLQSSCVRPKASESVDWL